MLHCVFSKKYIHLLSILLSYAFSLHFFVFNTTFFIVIKIQYLVAAIAMPHWYLGLTTERNIFASLPDLYTQGCDILMVVFAKIFGVNK